MYHEGAGKLVGTWSPLTFVGCFCSQDGTLKRCFGVDKKIDDCDWEYISSLRTLRAPHEPMPKLSELLAFLTEDGQENVWLLLDVKVSLAR